ncbi:hypothetical protein SCUCBS95973_002080 [Sporothrix curviconia]|uniref:Arabinogalactan endo-beta-1,4-galactanase n=1 Tax=Sporothrix curviconia TaxID=1260050 RepID=A0ABP0B4T4_9PEZI
MVGVPGRSKACHTCRQRRKASRQCGLERPRCNNCIKSNRFCTGYQRSRAFVFSKDMEPVSSADQPTAVPAASSTELIVAVVPNRVGQVTRWKTRMASPAVRGAFNARNARDDAPNDHAMDVVVAETTDRAARLFCPTAQHVSSVHADRDQYFCVFLQAYLPRTAQAGPHDPVTTRNFLVLLPQTPDIAPALEYAMLALCITKVGAVHGQRDVTCRGRDMYSRLLKELRLAVLNPTSRLHDQTLPAILLLAMYEFTECPGKEISGFNAHLGGAMNLLRLPGAAAHTTGLSRALLFGIRKLALFRSLYDSESSFLSTRDWQSLPYRVLHKNAYDELFDLLEMLPGLLAQVNAIKAEKHLPAMLTRTLTAIQQAWRIDKGFAAWYVRYDASVPGPLMVPRLSQMPSVTDNPSQGKLYPVAFDFSHFIVGQAMTLYWSGLVILYAFLSNSYKQLRRLVPAVHAAVESDCTCGCGDGDDDDDEEETRTMPICMRHFALDKLPPLGHRAYPRAMADQVCQSVEYFLQEDMGIFGGSMIYPPLLIVHLSLPMWEGDNSRQGQWIADMVQKIAKKENRMVVRRVVLSSAGLAVYLDLHYSDTWADPGHQTIPAGWPTDLDALATQLSNYTRDVCDAFAKDAQQQAVNTTATATATATAKSPPLSIISIGNEITNGLLWPVGSTKSWSSISTLLHAASAGIKASQLQTCCGGARPKIMIHLDNGWNWATQKSFYSRVLGGGGSSSDPALLHDADFDVMGVSYYPFYNAGATLASLRASLQNMAEGWGKELVVAETGWSTACPSPRYAFPSDAKSIPFTAAGQTAWVKAVADVVAGVKGGKGALSSLAVFSEI